MKKSSIITIVVVIIVIVIGVIWYKNSDSTTNTGADLGTASGSTSASVSETSKVSSTLSEYQNAELGFSVKYPTNWQREEGNSGVTFIIPIDNKAQTSTIGTLQASIQALSGTCAFPPVTTIKDRTTLKVGTDTLNTISMANTVQGRNYFNRMYSLQKGEICYMFSLASVTLAPSSKGLTGSNATQAENNNKAIVNTADSDFTAMVKTFQFITLPAGIDETKAPAKK